MTREEKIKKAISVAVAYHIEQEKAEALKLQNSSTTSWSRTGVEMMMTKRKMIQRRGRILRSA